MVRDKSSIKKHPEWIVQLLRLVVMVIFFMLNSKRVNVIGKHFKLENNKPCSVVRTAIGTKPSNSNLRLNCVYLNIHGLVGKNDLLEVDIVCNAEYLLKFENMHAMCLPDYKIRVILLS